MRESWAASASAWASGKPTCSWTRPAAVRASDREVVAICHHGGRSMQVAMFLEKQGFKRVHNLVGGIDAWSRTVDPAVPTY